MDTKLPTIQEKVKWDCVMSPKVHPQTISVVFQKSSGDLVTPQTLPQKFSIPSNPALRRLIFPSLGTLPVCTDSEQPTLLQPSQATSKNLEFLPISEFPYSMATDTEFDA
jgi:hypothetical protein